MLLDDENESGQEEDYGEETSSDYREEEEEAADQEGETLEEEVSYESETKVIEAPATAPAAAPPAPAARQPAKRAKKASIKAKKKPRTPADSVTDYNRQNAPHREDMRRGAVSGAPRATDPQRDPIDNTAVAAADALVIHIAARVRWPSADRGFARIFRRHAGNGRRPDQELGRSPPGALSIRESHPACPIPAFPRRSHRLRFPSGSTTPISA